MLAFLLPSLAVAAPPADVAPPSTEVEPLDVAHLRARLFGSAARPRLVNFWATWCGPCVAELPNVKKVYAAYRDMGFEVVGISLENAKLSPADTPGQTAAKLEKAKQILTDFTAKNAMPWPQYLEGKWWKNDISTRFGIVSIPAMFLIDQNGRLVTTEARGPKLEAEVKRLLKL